MPSEKSIVPADYVALLTGLKSQIATAQHRAALAVGRFSSSRGALAGQQANRGVFIKTSDFSSEAVAYAEQVATKIVLGAASGSSGRSRFAASA